MGQMQGLQGVIIPFAIFMVIFYFLLIRPQKKREKAHADMLDSITRGAVVVTAGGFYGKVCDILDDSYIIDLSDGQEAQPVKVRVLKSSIAGIKDAGEARPKRKKKKIRKHDGAPAETAQEAQGIAQEETAEAQSAE